MKEWRIDMYSSKRSILPKIPAYVSTCLNESPGSEKMIVDIHKLWINSPAQDLQYKKTNYYKLRIKIPGESFISCH
jgi:hypothetical protein